MIEAAIQAILKENERRQKENNAPFNPVTGEHSVGERKKFTLPDFPIAEQWLPVEMLNEPLVKKLKRAGSVEKMLHTVEGYNGSEEQYNELVEEFCRLRNRYDFAFWAATLAFIKNKGGGGDVLFWLNRPQRRLVERLERMRKAGKPIRLILLKARQWGGSTCIQLYMAWLQLCHMVGLNSLIIALQTTVSDEIKDMFDRMIKAYPVSMLHQLGDIYNENEPKMVGVGKSGNIYRVPQRNCKIKIGTMERPNSCRGGDYNLVHLSEVGLWKKTDGKKPEDIVRSACKGVLLKPYTMIVEESTPNGVGNYFHKEYLAAKNGESQFEALFVPWYWIEMYVLEFGSAATKIKNDNDENTAVRQALRAIADMPIEDFAEWLYKNRKSEEVLSDREEPGTYLWWLWEQGATLEGINWYIQERTTFTTHGDMASEYPSDDIEAFTFSGKKVFANEDVEQFRSGCRPPRKRGEVYGKANKGEEALKGLRFRKEAGGRLNIWHDVEQDDDEVVLDRYLVVVDVCRGTSEKADFADILVLDRLPMLDGEGPVVAAEWHGHIDMDELAWKSAQIAAYYNNAKLVIESNTLETTKDTRGDAEYILTLIADVYGNLYARKQSAEDIKQGVPKKYGFHTNTVTKKQVVNNLKEVIREKLYTEREEECLNEYIVYVETDKGGYEATDGYHDDRLMTRGIGLLISTNEMELPKIVSRNQRVGGVSRAAVSEATM